MNTPRWDSTRKRDRLHLWALRTSRQLWRKVPGVATWQAWSALRRTMYLEILEQIDGEWAKPREVFPFAVDRDTFTMQSTTRDGLERKVTLRFFSADPQVYGYPGSYTAPHGLRGPLPKYLGGLSGPPMPRRRARVLAPLRRYL